ncbi:amidase [Mycolicibacterium fortuitum]|nr:amidase [Mycolicibacterium fortuitum]
MREWPAPAELLGSCVFPSSSLRRSASSFSTGHGPWCVLVPNVTGTSGLTTYVGDPVLNVEVDRRKLLTAALVMSASAAAGGACATPAADTKTPAAMRTEPTVPHYASLLDTAAALKSGQTSPVELTRALLDRINRLQPSLHAYVTVTEQTALAQAEQAEREITSGNYRGPLHGIPIAVKDLCRTKGIPTTAGMSIYAQYRPDYDATVVQRLRDAGAILLGKLALTEGASGDYHPTVTPPINPWNPAHWAGSSSSGSAVATAAGLCFGALGTDTTGSIRYPAAANGVTGLKPTWGRISRHGVFALAESLDHVGPITRSAADAGAILTVIAGHDPNDPTSLSAPVPNYLANLDVRLNNLRIGIDPAYNEAGADPQTIAMVRAARTVFETLGADIKEIHVPSPGPLITSGLASCAAEAAIAHEKTYPSRRSEYGPLAELLDAGRAATGTDAMKAQQARLTFSGALNTLFTDIDVLLTPTQPPDNLSIERINQLWATPRGTALMWRFTEPFNMSGNPTLTLPGGYTHSGLPLTFQLVARHLDEQTLIRAGNAYQQATDWHQRHPID